MFALTYSSLTDTQHSTPRLFELLIPARRIHAHDHCFLTLLMRPVSVREVCRDCISFDVDWRARKRASWTTQLLHRPRDTSTFKTKVGSRALESTEPRVSDGHLCMAQLARQVCYEMWAVGLTFRTGGPTSANLTVSSLFLIVGSSRAPPS